MDANESVADQLKRSLLEGEAFQPSPAVPAARVVISECASAKDEESMSILELALHERSLTGSNEAEARNISRSKRRKLLSDDANDDYDDAYTRQLQQMMSTDQEKEKKRHIHRQVALHDRQQAMTKHCWWWLESPSFDSSRLICAADYLSLVWTPLHKELGHLSIVPLQHCPSLSVAPETIWPEIRQFHAALQRMYPSKQVILTESVRNSKRAFWQTRIQVAIVEQSVAQDLPLYLKTTLQHDYGVSDYFSLSPMKSLSSVTIDSSEYVWVQYDPTGKGLCAHVDKQVPATIVLDTLLGSMELEPLKFGGRPMVSEKEQKDFVEEWAKVDWTKE